MTTKNMDYRFNQNFKAFTGVLIIAFMIVFETNAQTVSVTLELEAISTKKFGKILMAKTIVRNQVGRKIFLDNFLKVMTIEKLNLKNDQFDDYSDQWFIKTLNDPKRHQICGELGITSPSHDSTFDKVFITELSNSNANLLDSLALNQWIDHVVGRLEVLEENGRIEFQTYLNSLPIGAYRLRFRYSNVVDSPTLNPVAKFKDARIPNRLLDYSRWLGEIDSGFIYLTIK